MCEREAGRGLDSLVCVRTRALTSHDLVVQVAALQALHGDRPPVCMHIHRDSINTPTQHQKRTVNGGMGRGGHYGPLRTLWALPSLM